MDKNNFAEKMTAYLITKGFEVDKIYLRVVFNFLNGKISDEEFNKGISKVIVMANKRYFEKYNGKPLSPEDFLNLCGYKSDLQLLDESESKELQAFLLKCRNYLSCDYLVIEDIRDFNRELNYRESTAISLCGGMSELYKSMRSDKYSRNLSNILKDLEYKFKQTEVSKEKPLEINNNVKKILPNFGKGG